MGELATRIRAKYPGSYDALSDADLESKVMAKYPGVYDHLAGDGLTRTEQLAKGAPMTAKESAGYAADRAAFAQEGGVKAFGEGAPTDTRRISYTDSGYRPNKPEKTLRGIARNTVQDVVELPLMPVRMLSEVANSPDTPATLAELGKGIVRGPLEFIPYAGEALGGRSAAEAWQTNPGFGAMTLAGAASLAKGARPTRVASEAPKSGGMMDAAATKLYDMTLKQGTTLRAEKRRQNVKTGLEGGYLPNSKGVDKLAADVSTAERQITTGIESGDAAAVRGTLDRAIANVEALRDQAKRSANPEKNIAMIDDEIARLKANPMQEGVEPVPSFKAFSKGKMGTYMKEEGSHGAAMQRLSREYKDLKAKAGEQAGSIPIGEMQRMKVEQGRHVKYQEKTGQAVDPFQATIDKARIRGLKEELETQLFDVFPELKQTNQKLGQLYQLQDVLERAASRIENNQGIGIGLPIKGGAGATIGGMVGGPAGAAVGGGIGTMIGIIEHPAVAPRLAVALYRASRGKMTKAQATAAANSRLDYLKKKLRDERGMAGRDIDRAARTEKDVSLALQRGMIRNEWFQGVKEALDDVASGEITRKEFNRYYMNRLDEFISDAGLPPNLSVKELVEYLSKATDEELAGFNDPQLVKDLKGALEGKVSSIHHRRGDDIRNIEYPYTLK